jgi:hypothetical protein
METPQKPAKFRLRPHHMFCARFMTPGVLKRTEPFADLEGKVISALRLSDDIFIEVIEGVDDLCNVCPLNVNGRCMSPQGDEDATRKWDIRILQGLGISYGYSSTTGKLRKLVAAKAPLDFCRNRCPHKPECSVF